MLRTSVVFVPCLGKKARFLEDWDLWGPLIYVLVEAIVVAAQASSNGHVILATIFFSNLFGALIVTLNARFLGVESGFFESICLIGYCLFPLSAGALVTAILKPILAYWIRFFVILGCFLWCCACSFAFSLQAW